MTRVRPWIFCIVFFVIFNVWIAHFFSSEDVVVYPKEELQKRVTYYTEHEIRKLLSMVATDPNPKVLVLGDSFLWGTGVSSDAIATEVLKQRLSESHPQLSLWNVALPASHAADVYAMLKVTLPMKPVAVILNTNYYFFTIPEDRNHMTQKWMLPYIANEPEYTHLLQSIGINPVEQRTKGVLQSILPIYRYKTELNVLLIGKSTGQDFITQEITGLYERLRAYWPTDLAAGKQTEATYEEFYDPHYIHDNQVNVIYAKKIADLLDQYDIPAYVFSTPQNPNVLGSLINNDMFDTNMEMINRIYQGQSFLYENLHGKFDPHYQMDNIHLKVAGHTALADLLYNRLMQIIDHQGMETR